MSARDIDILELKRQNAEEAARLHSEAFPTFFLSSLGERFLKEFYSAFLDEPSAICWTASCEGKLVGVVVGSANPAGFFSRLLRERWWRFAVAALRAVLCRPGIAPRLLRAFSYRGGGENLEGYALLSSIAVHPGYQGLGIGQKLVVRWLAEVNRRGIRGAYLTTDATNNESTNKFYQKCGWQKRAELRTPEGRIMNQYCYEFRSDTQNNDR